MRRWYFTDIQKFISSPFSEPFNTVQGLLDATMTGRTSDVVKSESGVEPLYIVLPLCIAIILVLLFVVGLIVFRSVTVHILYSFTLNVRRKLVRFLDHEQISYRYSPRCCYCALCFKMHTSFGTHPENLHRCSIARSFCDSPAFSLFSLDLRTLNSESWDSQDQAVSRTKTQV